MYEVRFYTGDYVDRQKAANRDRAICYVEHHFNASLDPKAGYATCVVGSNASAKSKQWATDYVEAIAREFGVKANRILVGGWEGRGDGNVRHTAMPAILLEPLFASNPIHASIIKSEEGQKRLASVLVDTIRRHFPQGGLVAFSVGHKYRKSKPNDRGAAVAGGGTEADYAERVLTLAAEMLERAHGGETRTLQNGVEICTCCGQPITNR